MNQDRPSTTDDLSQNIHATFENEAVGMAHIAPDGRFLRVNSKLCHITGYSEDELLARTSADLTHSEDLPMAEEHLSRLLAGQIRTYTIEKRYVRKDGSIVPVRKSTSLVCDADGSPQFLNAVIEDITERRKAEVALRESEERLRRSEELYRTLFNTIQDGFCIVRMIYDDEGRPIDYLMVEGNPAYEEHTGLKDSIGKSIREAEPNIEPFWIEIYGRIAKTGVPERFENYVEAWDRWFDVYAYRFGDPANHEVAIFFKEVTARKKTERALAEANQRVEAGLMAGEVATYSWDIPNDRLRGDKNFVRLFGVMKDEHDSAPLSEFVKVIHPDDLPRIRAALTATLERDEPYEIEYRIRANGPSRDRWVLVRGQIVERDADGKPLLWSGVLIDVTDRKQAQERVRASHETFQQLVENSPFGVFIVDGDFRLAVVSAGARKTFVNVRPLIGRDFAEVLRVIWPEPAASEFIEIYRQTLATGEPYHSPSTVGQRLDIKQTGAYDWKIERIKMPDGRYGVVCHFYDWSERQRLEEAMREADRRKDEFLAVLSHELRNPLAAIRMATTALRSDADVREEMVEIVERQSEQLVRLVDDLLDISRVTRGKISLRIERIDLAPIITEAAEGARHVCEASGLNFALTIPKHPVYAMADSLRISQIIDNLLSNACKYTSEGGHVHVTLATQDDQAIIKVRDTGVGIPADHLDRVFDMFAQVDPEVRKTGGLGIGLALVKGIAELHGGSAEAHSDGEGKGSEFIVRLPLAQEARITSSDIISDSPAPALHRPRRRILAVDDNTDALVAIAHLLRLQGDDVITAEGGEQAIELAREHRPEIVLLDIGMPGMNGYEVARRIRSETWGRDLTLIAVTGWGQEKDKREAADAGFDAHLTKPVEPDLLENLLAQPRA